MPIRALIWKEVRGNLGVLAIGLIVLALWLMRLVESSLSVASDSLKLTETTEVMLYALIAGSFSTLYGFWSAHGESRDQRWHYLLFRPMSRRAVMLSKIIAGAMTCGATTLLPVLVYVAYLQVPGAMLAPFDLRMTIPMLTAWMWTLPLFVGAIWSGLRDARWWWSKSWPVLAVLFAGFWVWFLPMSDREAFEFSLANSSLAWIGCMVTLITSLLYVTEEQDFS